MPQWLSAPNLLTLSRLAAAPFVVAAILKERHVAAAGIFLAAALTDSFDGLLARRTRAVTRFGAYLDPVADKLFLTSVFLALALSGAAPWWYVAAVLGRDVFILLFAAWALAFTRLREFAPSAWGKASTFFQIVTVTSLVVRNAAPAPFVVAFAAAALHASAAVTLISAAHYAWRAAVVLRRLKPQHRSP